MDAPEFPFGPYESLKAPTMAQLSALIDELAKGPADLRSLASKLSNDQLETKYRNWTVRQIIHHLADSQMNGMVRFRLALTEEIPVIKPYNETGWSQLPDALSFDVGTSFDILDAFYQRWIFLLKTLTEEQFQRTYFHPELKAKVPLSEALNMYVWHFNHHLKQIQWLADQHGW